MRPPEHAGASNESLIAASQSGDERAFAELYRRYARDVRRWCARRVGDHVRAEDLMQETFLRAFAHISTFNLGHPFWPWLAAIARGVCADELHSGTDRRTISLDEDEGHQRIGRELDEGEAVDRRLALAAALSSLTPQDRRFIWLHEVEERSYEEIARTSGSSVDAVRNRTWRARGWLRAALHDVRSLWPLPPIVPALRDGARRLRARVFAILTRLEEQSGALLFQGAVMALASVAVIPGLLGHSHTSAGLFPSKVVRSTVESRPAAEGRPAQNGEARRQFIHPSSDEPPGVLQASIRTKTREGAAAPESARLRIEVRGPDGQVLFWGELEHACVLPTNSLSQDGPVRAYC